ncbi:retrovirus-related pol polyprotein from transposon TNT 1-94 [Tanacetum coccineum]|uniref:Retrovirus-related pol polyprotein from transposon TNT 1-94 n=1 Tax=Tanacetum coccineum TaxID=301880 RepID=A0ABQ4WJE3_9ASTR
MLPFRCVVLIFGGVTISASMIRGSSDASSDMTPGKVIGVFIQASVALRSLRFFSLEERILTMLITLGIGSSVIPMPSTVEVVSYLVRVFIIISPIVRLFLWLLHCPLVILNGSLKGQSLMEQLVFLSGKDKATMNVPSTLPVCCFPCGHYASITLGTNSSTLPHHFINGLDLIVEMCLSICSLVRGGGVPSRSYRSSSPPPDGSVILSYLGAFPRLLVKYSLELPEIKRTTPLNSAPGVDPGPSSGVRVTWVCNESIGLEWFRHWAVWSRRGISLSGYTVPDEVVQVYKEMRKCEASDLRISKMVLKVYGFVRYGYIKNHKKTVKNKQARTRERKSEQKPEAKPGKVVNVVCAECGKCVFNSNHDACVSRYLNDVNARTKKPNVVPISASKPKRKANKSVATPHKKTVASDTTIQKSKSYHKELYENTNQEWKWWIAKRCPSGYTWTQKPLRTKKIWMPKIRKEDVSTSISPTIDIVSRITNIVQLILFIVDSGCTKHMTGNLKLLCNFVEKFLGTVRFGNDQFAPILGYGDLNQGNVMIKWVYYVEGLKYNLFLGNDLLTGNRGSDLYTISLQETTSSTPICFMAKASPTQAWLWHRRLSHLNFDYITLLLKKDIVTGLPKLKYVKDQLCSSCEMSKAKRSSFKSKAIPSSKGRLNLLHMDLCGPMRVASINGKKYILVIVDDYSRYTWTLFLRSKDETPKVLKDFLTMIQRNLQAQVISVRTDRGIEFLNKTLHTYFKEEGIEHQTSTPRTPEQNGVVERRNRTLVKAARTMLSASKLPLSFWAEAVATACYTQNRSIIILTHGKTMERRRDGENWISEVQGDPCVMVGYSTSLVSSRNKASDNETLTLCPKKKMLFPYSKEDIYSSHNRVRVEFSLQSLYFGKEYYHPTHGTENCQRAWLMNFQLPDVQRLYLKRYHIDTNVIQDKIQGGQTLIMPDALILSTSGGIQFLSDKLLSWMSKKHKLHCNVFSRGRVRGVICKLCSSNVDEDTTSRLWLQLQQNTVVL